MPVAVAPQRSYEAVEIFLRSRLCRLDLYQHLGSLDEQLADCRYLFVVQRKPPLVIVATEVVAEAHVTCDVRFCVLLSLKVPVAVNCCVRPFEIVGLAGVTAIDCNVAAVTVSTVEPVMLPSFALIVLVPVATPVARPPLVIVATEVVAEAHVT